MPVSKRDKKVSLTKTQKKGMSMKQKQIEDVRKFLDNYDNLFVFTTNNMRNGPLKDLRDEWNDSRFFFAKRRVMALALGRTEADEVQKNIHKIASYLVGQCGILFTNRNKDEVLEWFRDFSKMEFAKSGFVATETVVLPAGPLPDFSFSLEPHLRLLGMPTQLEKGIIVLREDYTVCTQGSKLTPEQSNILKLFGKQMAEFKVKIVCMWSKDGSFERFKVPKATKKLISQNKKELKKKKSKKNIPAEENVRAEEEITQLFDQQTINESDSHDEVEKGSNAEKTVSAPLSYDEEVNTQPKKKKKEKVSTENPEDEGEKSKPTEKSPKITRENPRRSMRTPKPVRRSPEVSVKRLTESAKKTKSAIKDKTTKPTRSTPRKRIFEEPEDVEMAT